MNSQQLLLINFVIVIILIGYFLFWRSKPSQTMKLNMKSGENAAKTINPPELKAQSRIVEPLQEDVITLTQVEETPIKNTIESPVVSEEQPVVPKKNLRIYFVYNGHEWECHEVLGIPPGSNIQVATEIYQHLIKTSDSSTFQFYESAYTAILKRRGSS